MDYGNEKSNIAILEAAAERLEEAGYTVAVHKEYKQREGVTAEHKVEIQLRAWKDLPVKK
jgi:dihydroorotase-like cyclic amidohydrolase